MLHTCNLLPEKMILILQDDNFPLKLKTINVHSQSSKTKLTSSPERSPLIIIIINNNNNRKF